MKRPIWILVSICLPVLILLNIYPLFQPPLAAAPSTKVVIAAAYYDSYETGDPDEAIQIQNISSNPVDVSGWKLSDGSVANPTTLPPGTTLTPGQTLWLADEGLAFQRQFGFLPDFERTEVPGFKLGKVARY